ncbi:Flagellar hook-length control protein [Massilia sp. Bi118]|uniref:flagellar hook-length control protein FliK n=1 Tax=Massilia sp. Bi118 TaxID=2822346 RepID=UPI001D6406FD|nr:flagellar hook-length control protein FliK [Massilia sp. Bi118]CAH0299639.1 Flagellar hook-length control protein [Massilia sp. Bi118]
MQTNALNIQLNANAAAPAQRNGAAANSDAAQFGAMLSNEMEMRQPAPAPAAPKAEAPKPQAADKPAQPDDAAPQQAAKPDDATKPAAAGKADDAQDADKADSDKDAADEQSGEASDPASAMLALMASLQKPAEDTKTDAAKGAASQAFDALNGAGGKGKRGETAQLAALQAAMKAVAKDGSGIATTAGKAFSDTAALRNPALAAAGAGIVADDKAATDAGAKLGADLRAALAAAPGQGQAESQLSPSELSAALALQQARESAAAREPAAAVSALAQAQPAVLEAVQAAAAAADELSARVGTEAWENQVGQKVVYMVGNDEQTASLTLNPPDLGPLQVVLSVSNDQASVTFSANQEEVRQALEDALPRLREMMSESGIALNNASVNAGMPDNRQAQEQAARNSGGFGGNNRGRGDGGNANDDAAPRTVTRTATLGDRGMVDTFA